MEITVLNIMIFLFGFIMGGLITFFFAQKRHSELTARLRIYEVMDEDKKRVIKEREVEIENLRERLSSEREEKIGAKTRMEEAEKRFKEEITRFDMLRKEMVDTFKALSLDALRSNTEEFIKLAEEKLKTHTMDGKREIEAKKELIDKTIEAMGKTLSEVQRRIEDVGKTNSEKITEVSALIRSHEEVTLKLKETAEQIGHALASPKKRGEWGERMAEDIIRLVGMVEGVNYVRQKTIEGNQGRPDYTFFLPNKMKVNMDVKFPLENYLRYLKAESEHDKRRYRDELLKNVRGMIKEVTTREYINPSEDTVDYVLIFIPNEQVYGFIQESDVTLMDEALKSKVILCSPFTLYAVLSVIRQAMENFHLEKTASEILKLLGEFSKQWTLFKERLNAMGDKIEAAKKEYDILVTTRSNTLEKPLKKIAELGRQKALGVEIDSSRE
ncbi:MAG: DNA recombination protein RmuC [Syntrophorhabdaceae bacterium]|nr:DNA recombination protein RmuC [Syntrophorhabdaceae bacterium]